MPRYPGLHSAPNSSNELIDLLFGSLHDMHELTGSGELFSIASGNIERACEFVASAHTMTFSGPADGSRKHRKMSPKNVYSSCARTHITVSRSDQPHAGREWEFHFDFSLCGVRAAFKRTSRFRGVRSRVDRVVCHCEQIDNTIIPSDVRGQRRRRWCHGAAGVSTVRGCVVDGWSERVVLRGRTFECVNLRRTNQAEIVLNIKYISARRSDRIEASNRTAPGTNLLWCVRACRPAIEVCG
jgi:hypothetical protein